MHQINGVTLAEIQLLEIFHQLEEEQEHLYLQLVIQTILQQEIMVVEQDQMADLAAAAHLSVLDYLGDINWEKHTEAKTWYAKMKSRPSFRDLLADQVVGLMPPPHYSDIDF